MGGKRIVQMQKKITVSNKARGKRSMLKPLSAYSCAKKKHFL